MTSVVQPGQILGGKFQVERVLGQGGMGVVVSAYHMILGQRVALKFLLPEHMQSQEAYDRFLREARAVVRLRSEHVCRVIDVGTLETGSPYIVMEYLDGIDLSGHIARHGALSTQALADYMLQACDAIAEAHALGIVHRDLKPANMFVTTRTDGRALIKVLDFGISKAAVTDRDFSLTRTSMVMGSPGYMSPEQLRSARDVDPRSDIWALGVILYELISGTQPFVAESITELALKVGMDPLPALRVAVPPGFDAVIGRCLEKNPAQRFQNVAELASALAPYGSPGAVEAAERIARVLQVPFTPSRTGTQPAVGAPTTMSGSSGQTGAHEAPRSSRAGLFVAMGLVVAGAIIAIVVVTSKKPADPIQPVVAPTPDAAVEKAVAKPVEVTPDAAVVAAPIVVIDAAVAVVVPDAAIKKVKPGPGSAKKPPGPGSAKPPTAGSGSDIEDSRQ